MCKKTRSTPPWSELPPELLQLIGELTGYPIHQIQFRAVCKPWRSALGMVENRGMKNFPLKIPFHPSLGFIYSFAINSTGASLCIVLTKSYVIQPTNGSSFLVTADEVNPGFLSPRYPLSATHWELWNKCKWFNLLENRVRVLDSGFSLRVLHIRGNVSEKDGRENELRNEWRRTTMKAVSLSNPICEDDLLIVVLCDFGKLIALRVKEGEWKVVFDSEVSRCVDVVKFKEKLYGIDHLGGAFFIDFDYHNGDSDIVAVAPALRDDAGRAKRLVVDSSYDERRIYMVVQMISSSDFAFSVYELNEDEGVWEKVSNIGSRMFFVGINFSFCATSRDFPGLSTSCKHSHPHNCIFFGKGSFPRQMLVVQKGDTLLSPGMNIGQYYLGDKCATGILEPAFVTMFTPQTYFDHGELEKSSLLNCKS